MECDLSLQGKLKGGFYLFESYCSYRMAIINFAYFGKQLNELNFCSPG